MHGLNVERKLPAFIQPGIVVNVGSACVIPRLRRIRRKGVVGKRSDTTTASVSEPFTTLYSSSSQLVRSTSTGSSSHIVHQHLLSFMYNSILYRTLMILLIALARISRDITNRYGRKRFLFASFSLTPTPTQRNWDVVPYMVRRTKWLLTYTWLALSEVGRYSFLLLRKQSHCVVRVLYILHTYKLLPKSFKTLSYMLYMSLLSIEYTSI